MSEIEKMYRRCKIKKQQTCRSSDTCYSGSLDRCEGCNSYQYPPFTAEKQIELIKWLIQNKRLCIHKAEYSNNFYMDTATTRLNGVDNSSFEECLAGMLNLIWQDCTEVEQEQIRRILNE